MKRPLRRLLDWRVIAHCGMLAFSVQVGFLWGLQHLRNGIERTSDLNLESWERFTGNVLSISPTVTIAAIIGYLVLVSVSPDVPVNENKVLNRLATRKLGSPLLTQDEMLLWSRIEEETRHEH